MKNPYLFGYLPFITVICFSLTFGVYTVGFSIELFKEIGLYTGMREFLSDVELRVFLLIVYALLFFIVFSSLKLIGKTIHNTAMLFFSKDEEGLSLKEAQAGRVIYFIGALITATAIQSIVIMVLIFLVTTILYFMYTVYKLSLFLSIGSMIGLIMFEVLLWGVFISTIVYIMFKLYNGVLASLPV